MIKKLPNKVARFFWSADLNALDLEKHKVYIVHQILSCGDLEASKWLFDNYGINEVKRVFHKHPQRLYSKKSFNFVSHYLLDLDSNINQNKYVSLSS
ncbi:MAG: hypothetical protein ABIJ03_02365 [Patescibacteria group bacterium]|nr:hypothetical protein [Patescibacteria group bacterium]